MSVDVEQWRGVAADEDAERTAAEAPDEKATIRLRAVQPGAARLACCGRTGARWSVRGRAAAAAERGQHGRARTW